MSVYLTLLGGFKHLESWQLPGNFSQVEFSVSDNENVS